MKHSNSPSQTWFARISRRHALRAGGIAASALALGGALAQAQAPQIASGGSPSVSGSSSSVTRQSVTPGGGGGGGQPISGAAPKSFYFEYIEEGGPLHDFGQQTGFGVEIDPVNGDLKLKAPVFSVSTPLGDDTAQTSSDFVFEHSYSNGSSFSSTTANASIGAKTAIAKFAASLSLSDVTGSTNLSSGFTLAYHSRWAPKLVDLTQPSSFTYSAEALAILSDPQLSSEERAARWQDRFGTHVIIGYGFRGKVGVHVSVNSSSSFSESYKFASLAGSYYGVSGAASFANLVKQAQNGTALSVAIKTEGAIPTGVSIPSIPNLDTLSTTNGQIAFANDLKAAAEKLKKRQGIFVVSAESLPAVVYGQSLDLDLGSIDDLLLTEAATTAQLAIKNFITVSHMLGNPQLKEFLNNLPAPNQGISVAALLQEESGLLLPLLKTLWTKMAAYYAKPNPQTKVAFEAAIAAAQPQADKLKQALYTMSQAVNQLPPMTIEVTEDWLHTGNLGGHTGTFVVTLDNYGAFGDPSSTIASITNWLAAQNTYDPLQSPITMFADYNDFPNYLLTGWLVEHVSIDSLTYYTSGPKKGLCKLVFRAKIHMQGWVTWARIQVKDMLLRSSPMLQMNVAADSSHGPM